jgi:hypothetical protein
MRTANWSARAKVVFVFVFVYLSTDLCLTDNGSANSKKYIQSFKTSSRISLSVTREVSEKSSYTKKIKSNHPQTKTDPPAALSMIASLNGLGKFLALNQTQKDQRTH